MEQLVTKQDLEAFVGQQGLQPSFGYEEGGKQYNVKLHYIGD